METLASQVNVALPGFNRDARTIYDNLKSVWSW